MSTEDVIEPEQSSSPVSPGRLLSDAREGAGLSQKEVADKLHITVHYVRSIEQDAYEKLPGAIFAKGYIKRYAEILNLDVEQTLDTFENYQQDQQEQRNEVTRIHARKNRARNRNFAIASVLAFVALFVGLWAWNTMSVEVAPVADNRARNDVIGDRISSAMEQEDASLPAAAEPQAESSSTSRDASSNLEPGSVEALEDSAANQSYSAIPSTTATGSTTSQGAESEDDQEITVIAISNEGDDVLRVSFDDDSFIQVNDDSANRIYRGTLGRGEVLEITADGPFDVLIGDAPLTHMTLNGAEVDVMESVRIDNSARLTVGL